LSDGTKRTFFWADPGKPKTTTTTTKQDSTTTTNWDPATTTNETTTSVALDDYDTISPYFALCIVIPDRVDELHLGGNQKRFIHTLSKTQDRSNNHEAMDPAMKLMLDSQQGVWIREEVNP